LSNFLQSLARRVLPVRPLKGAPKKPSLPYPALSAQCVFFSSLGRRETSSWFPFFQAIIPSFSKNPWKRFIIDKIYIYTFLLIYFQKILEAEIMLATKALTLHIPLELHRELKILAASSGKTMKELLIEAINILTAKTTTKRKQIKKPENLTDLNDLMKRKANVKHRNYSDKQIEEFIKNDSL